MGYSEIDGRIVRDDGWIAVKYMQTIPHLVEVHKNGYVFTVNSNVNMVWVHPDDVDAILSIVRVCCGGSHHKKYTLSNLRDVQLWSGGS